MNRRCSPRMTPLVRGTAAHARAPANRPQSRHAAPSCLHHLLFCAADQLADPRRPAVCSSLRPAPQLCGRHRGEVLLWRTDMGVLTSRMSPDVARLLRQYPSLAAIDPGLRDEVIAHQVQWIQAPEGAMLFDEGSRCRGFPMVISGEFCVASTSCTVGARPMQAHGIATQPTELALLDPAGFDRWCGEASFRRFVFAVFAERLADLMALVEAVAFQRLDQRLAAALLGYGPVVHVTHQALAEQLGTAREIVTRLLKRFEQAGQLRLSRERIDVLDAAALRARAEPTGPA